MSFFGSGSDDDDTSSSSSADAMEAVNLLKNASKAPTPSPAAPRIVAPTARGHGYTSLLKAGSSIQTEREGNKEEKSVFGNSIAKALQLKKETQQELLLGRLKRQREAEKNDAELVEKDLQVAPFVSPAYRKVLRERTTKPTNTPAEEEEEDLLDKYIADLEKSAPAKTASETTEGGAVNFYDKQMNAILLQGAKSEAPAEEATPVSAPSALPVAENGSTGQAPSTETLSHREGKPEAKTDHQKELFVLRELRKRRRVDDTFIEAATQRSEERILVGLRSMGMRV
ncbi:hypothetical protein AGDE_15371 [Angomonas deanei]|uniref:Uncharacterized protein n=1 Tax=Angomonas deanei TaxID=59799 RepID=A0A7G2CEL4_9TRYP|nr:hypothetical protein AGDE_15371 [Angomonas deanei]CAD2217785.1 hypothetical protein, conserved [Angomonas deanei]|eukprot:EPY19190.1 hypothetical protein AGDE_15371 [Angomonas deanei]